MANPPVKPSQGIAFKDLKVHIADAIKESCFTTEARLYNIANSVHNIMSVRNIKNYNANTGINIEQDLSKIVDKTVRDSIGVGCDLSVVVKGLVLGAFRASPVPHTDYQTTIRILINEILRHVFDYKGNLKDTISGIMAAVMTIAMEFKYPLDEVVQASKADILFLAKAIDPQFSDDVQKMLP